MLATNQTANHQAIAELALPELDVRALARRAGPPAVLAAAAVAVVLLAGGRIQAFTDGVRRGLGVSPVWAAAGAVFECVSLVGYMGLLSLVVGRATSRIGARESAQITLAGAAATRLLPTAGAGGVALTIWTLRRAGLRSQTAARTLIAFMLLLYSVFLLAIVVSGAVLALGPAAGPVELSAVPAVVAMLPIALCLALAWQGDREPEIGGERPRDLRRRSRAAAGQRLSRLASGRRLSRVATGERLSRVAAGVRLLGECVRQATELVRLRDPRLAGAIAYWGFDAAVVWATLRAFGSAPAIPVIALAYFVGQVANTLPIPGSVSAGMAGVLIAFGVPAAVAVPSVLTYRAIAIWLPTPLALAAVPALRGTIARWAREDAAATAAAARGSGRAAVSGS
ncbi:MAG TPA: lysylphosphatidylglycerol synthase domain-containing protein [Solirubrobacteraceae bacterium]|jgi:uncharacterized membrane protein YbhN (UPF0104 family)|nr:lysylphosphatidylglycerol synthase domain-containing protein [Solirubrobacteraceae bacterium]